MDNDKYYVEDHGIRNIVAGTRRDQDIEKVIENIVYQQLIHLGYEVNVGQLLAGEVDFVCTNSAKERIYIQVSYLLAHEETIEREYGALRGIKDNYPKYIISLTPLVKRNNDEGIIHLGLREFLMNGLWSIYHTTSVNDNPLPTRSDVIALAVAGDLQEKEAASVYDTMKNSVALR